MPHLSVVRATDDHAVVPAPRVLPNLLLPSVVLVPFLVLLAAVLAVGKGPLGVDTWWAGVVAGWHSSALTSAANVVSDLGGGLVGGFVVPAALAVLVWWLRSRAAAIVFVAGGVLSLAATQVIKHLVERPRPPTAGLGGALDPSFPSGHVTNAATLALLLVLLLGSRRLVWLAVVWPVLMALSRTVLGVHWLSDTVAGASLGAAAALVTVLLALVVGTRRSLVALTVPPPWPTTAREGRSGSRQATRESFRP